MFAGQAAQYLSKASGEIRSKWMRILSILLGISSAIYIHVIPNRYAPKIDLIVHIF